MTHGWFLQWLRYDDCPRCGALAMNPCKDQRWLWKHPNGYRYINKPHRGRPKKR